MALKYLRDNLKSLSLVLWGVIGVFVLLVFFEWGGYNDRQGGRDEVAAWVGDDEVTFAEFQNHYRQLENYYRRTFGESFNQDLVKQLNLPKQALDQLIERKILLMEARKIGLKATDNEVQKTILDIPVFKDEAGQFIGAEEYRKLLRSNRLTVDEFESSVREDVLLDKLETILQGTSYVSDKALEDAYRETAEQAKIRYYQLPANQFGEVTASDEEVAAYFEDHQEDYALPEKRVVSYLLVDKLKLRRTIELPEEELKAYYDSNPEEFTREEQVRARHILLKVNADRTSDQAEQELLAIRQRIEGGEDFAEVAKEVSEDEGTASRGGSLGFFGRNQMIKAFEDAAFAAEIGELVGPVKTDYGFHLIDVQDHRPGGPQPFENVKAQIQNRLVGEQADTLAANKADELLAELEALESVSAESLAARAEQDSEFLTFETTEPFGQSDNIAGIGRSPEFNASAFDLQEGGLSKTIQLPRGWAVLHLDEIQPPRTPELAEVEGKVRQAANLEKRKKEAEARLESIRQELESGADATETLASLGVEPTESEEFGRFGFITGLGNNREIIDTALESEVGAWGGPVLTNQGAVLFEVIERKHFDAEEFESQKDSTRGQVEGQRLSEIRRSLIELRSRDLTPRYSQQVLDNFEIGQVGAS